MATVVKRAVKTTKEKVFKPFNLKVRFDNRADAIKFADAVLVEFPEIANEIVDLANK